MAGNTIRALTLQHRQAQLAVRAHTLRSVLTIWPAFNPDDIDGTWAPVQEALTTLIDARRRDSAGIASSYYQAARLAEKVPGRATPILAARADPTAVAVSLVVTGPATVKRLTAQGARNAGDVALTRVAGAVGRHVLDAGRETLIRTTQVDRRARGWQRVTGGTACTFCEMLAGRGAVYSEGSSDFESHDHCACTAEPVFA